jgi:hypothetical protein
MANLVGKIPEIGKTKKMFIDYKDKHNCWRNYMPGNE